MSRTSIERKVGHDESLIGRHLKLNRTIEAPDISGKFSIKLSPDATFVLSGFKDSSLLVAGLGSFEGKTQAFTAVVNARGKFTVMPEHRQKFTSSRALIKKDGKILCGLKKQNTYGAGLWELPGGRLESGETFEAALMRECVEEIGVTVVPDSEIFTCTEYGLAIIIEHHIFTASIISGEPRPLFHEKLDWLDLHADFPKSISLIKLVNSDVKL
jgi:8-oxo-dGTP diphosphatase